MRVFDLHEATREIAKSFRLGPEIVVEHYPSWRCRYTGRTRGGGVFAYQFFDKAGRNCGYWLPDLDSLHVFEPHLTRLWGFPKEHVMRTPEVR